MSRILRLKVFIVAFAVAAAAIFLGSDARAQEPGAQEPGAQQTLVLGIHPYLSPSELVGRFSPLAKHLGVKTGRKIEVSIARDYNEHIARTGEGRIDLAYMGPASYVTLVSTYGVRPILAVHEVAGKSSFRGVIVKRAGSDIKSLGDLRGKRFAFGDPESTMSSLVPRYMLLEAGVALNDLSGHEHLENHNNVALGVLVGDFDAGALKEETFYMYRGRGLEAVAFSPEISEHLFVARAGLSDELVSELREAMYGLSSEPDGGKILEAMKPGATGLVAGDDKGYDSLRRIMEGLKKEGVGP